MTSKDLVIYMSAMDLVQVYSKKPICKMKNPAYGRHQFSWPLRIVGPIQIWRGCVIHFNIYIFFFLRLHDFSPLFLIILLIVRLCDFCERKKIILGKSRVTPQKTQENPQKDPGKPRENPGWGGVTIGRPGSGHVIWGPMRGPQP